jgi:2-polyprenyl-3-methyl-5-hydroxy-6-metoxy-1,4-benzoquinol methylase
MMMDKVFNQIKIDDVRSYWNNRPCNIRHSKKTIGTKEYFDEVTARKYFVEPNLPVFANFPSVKNKTVLEIGCGIGTATMSFASHGADVTAVDLSDQSLNLAMIRANTYGLQNNIQFYQGNVEDLKNVIPNKQYDLIFSFGVIHHTPNPALALKQIHHFLKPDGKLKIMVYHRYSSKVLGILFKYGKGKFWQLSKLIAKYSEAQMGCPVTYSYTRSEIKKLLESCGFIVEKIMVDHIFPYEVEKYVKYEYVKKWYFRFLPNFVFRALEKTFGWHLCVIAKKQ